MIWGNGMKLAVLEEAGVAGFDAIVALTGLDADNLAICQVAKKFRHPHPAVHRVQPENTAIFRQLGVTAAISATATLAQAIRGALELPDPVGAKARAATAAAVAAAEAGNGEGDGADGTADDEEDPGAPSPFRSILGSWHHLGKERR
ncbi:MAG: NAD-binding protein [Adlercreutzia equolifaciens]